MPGRRIVVLAALASATAFGGGVAVAATHGTAKPAPKPAVKVKPRAARSLPRTVHYGCHHGDHAGAALPAL